MEYFIFIIFYWTEKEQLILYFKDEREWDEVMTKLFHS